VWYPLLVGALISCLAGLCAFYQGVFALLSGILGFCLFPLLRMRIRGKINPQQLWRLKLEQPLYFLIFGFISNAFTFPLIAFLLNVFVLFLFHPLPTALYLSQFLLPSSSVLKAILFGLVYFSAYLEAFMVMDIGILVDSIENAGKKFRWFRSDIINSAEKAEMQEIADYFEVLSYFLRETIIFTTFCGQLSPGTLTFITFVAFLMNVGLRENSPMWHPFPFLLCIIENLVLQTINQFIHISSLPPIFSYSNIISVIFVAFSMNCIADVVNFHLEREEYWKMADRYAHFASMHYHKKEVTFWSVALIYATFTFLKASEFINAA
jgi:hypothetical protein